MPETKVRCRECGDPALPCSDSKYPFCEIHLIENLKQEKIREDANSGILAGEGGETDARRSNH